MWAVGFDEGGFVRSSYQPYGLASVLYVTVGALAGIYLLFALCHAAEALLGGRLLRPCAVLGRHVMTVYALHMLVKTLLDLLYVYPFCDGQTAALDAFYMGLVPSVAWGYMLPQAAVTVAVCLLVARAHHARMVPRL